MTRSSTHARSGEEMELRSIVNATFFVYLFVHFIITFYQIPVPPPTLRFGFSESFMIFAVLRFMILAGRFSVLCFFSNVLFEEHVLFEENVRVEKALDNLVVVLAKLLLRIFHVGRQMLEKDRNYIYVFFFGPPPTPPTFFGLPPTLPYIACI